MSIVEYNSTPLNYRRSLMNKSRCELVDIIQHQWAQLEAKDRLIAERDRALGVKAETQPCRIMSWGHDLRCETHGTLWDRTEENPPCPRNAT